MIVVPQEQPIMVKEDDRGSFAAFWPNKFFVDASSIPPIKRVYYVVNHRPDVIRGFHFHKKEWKIFTILKGSAKFVCIDPEQPKKEKLYLPKWIFCMSENSPKTIIVPPGFANGWMSLEPETILVCASTATFDESVADDKRFDPLEWGDVWTIKNR